VCNDAKACYDRIIENVRSLTLLREGLAPKIATLHAQTLRHMKYPIKTQNGISPTDNEHMRPDPFLGSGLGAGDSMSRWGFISDAVIRAFKKQAESAPIVSLLATLIQEHIQAFVNDSHGITIQDPRDPTTIHGIIEHKCNIGKHCCTQLTAYLKLVNANTSNLALIRMVLHIPQIHQLPQKKLLFVSSITKPMSH
jgi:hypothetical protein